jgi:hypothetical protein
MVKPAEARTDADILGRCLIDFAAMHAEFEKHGPAAIEKVREENPAAFLKIVAELAMLLDRGD